MFHHGIEDGQQLAHTGDQSHFRDLPSGAQALSKGLEDRMVTYRHEGTPRQGCADLGAPTPDRASPTQGSTARCKGARPTNAARCWRLKIPSSGRSSTSVLAHTGPIPGTLRKRSSRSRQTGLARRTGIESIVQGHEAGIAPRDMGLDIRVEAARRTPEAVLLRRPHGHELPPPGKKRTQSLGLRVGNRAGRGVDRPRKVGQGAGIEGIGLRQLAGGLRNITDLARIGHHDRQGGGSQRRAPPRAGALPWLRAQSASGSPPVTASRDP